MDDAQAEAVIVDRLLGPDCLPAQIHRGDFVDEAQVTELFDALTRLTPSYAGRDQVPKAVALALLDISARFENRFYPEARQERLEDIAAELHRLAEGLLGGA